MNISIKPAITNDNKAPAVASPLSFMRRARTVTRAAARPVSTRSVPRIALRQFESTATEIGGLEEGETEGAGDRGTGRRGATETRERGDEEKLPEDSLLRLFDLFAGGPGSDSFIKQLQ